jgi:hypothetical protein
MPLDYSGTRNAIGENIRREEAAGKPHDQAVAIALDVNRRSHTGNDRPVKHHNSETQRDGTPTHLGERPTKQFHRKPSIHPYAGGLDYAAGQLADQLHGKRK